MTANSKTTSKFTNKTTTCFGNKNSFLSYRRLNSFIVSYDDFFDFCSLLFDPSYRYLASAILDSFTTFNPISPPPFLPQLVLLL